jgi:hypothetical protein
VDQTVLFNPFADWFGSAAPAPEGTALDLLTTVSRITVVRDPPSPLLKPSPIGVFLVPVPQLDGPFRLVYQFDTSFPPPAADPVAKYPPDPTQAILLNPLYQDIADISNLAAPVPANPQPLPLPRARDVRIRLMAVAHNANPAYFGDPSIQVGLTTSLDTRSDEGAEADLFDPSK